MESFGSSVPLPVSANRSYQTNVLRTHPSSCILLAGYKKNARRDNFNWINSNHTNSFTVLMKEETINICPSWRGIANTCILLLEVGNEDARQTAKEEIRKMGDILDQQWDNIEMGHSLSSSKIKCGPTIKQLEPIFHDEKP